jgi:hypothetical protein
VLEHVCEVCGKRNRKKLKANGLVVCSKHYSQFKHYGYFRDNSPRTQRDRNKIIKDYKNGVAYIELYDKFYNVIDKAIIDIEDVPKVQYRKWRKNGNGYCITEKDRRHIFLHRVVLNTDKTVDHINENKLDNRKGNLRICTKSTNQMNVAKYKGYYQTKNGSWLAKIKMHGKQLHLGIFQSEQEAYFCRWYAEKLLFKHFASDKKAEPIISEERKKDIKTMVEKKVQRLQ